MTIQLLKAMQEKFKKIKKLQILLLKYWYNKWKLTSYKN